MSKYNPTKEFGTSGLNHYDGMIEEEFLRELSGDKKIRVYKEMGDNDYVASSILFLIRNLIGQVDWRVESEDNEDVAEFIDSCRNDMSQSWSETISEIFTFIQYGFSYHEIVYKRRNGIKLNKPGESSKYNDGKLGWRKLPSRSQLSLVNNWVFDKEGGLQGVNQVAAPDYNETFIPIEKALLFRTTSLKGNPEGQSLLRGAYRSWYIKKNIENLEAIGLERDLAGLPIAYVPAKWLRNDASTAEKQTINEIKDIVTNIRRDEQEGIVWPLAYDENGNKVSYLELLTSGGKREFDTNKIIVRYNLGIALAALADVILLGHEKVGSYSLGETKADFFTMALECFLDHVASVFNRHAIPRLLSLNGISIQSAPQLVHSGLKKLDLTAIGTFIRDTTGAGLQFFPDEKLENFLRSAAGLPVREQRTEKVQKITLDKKAELKRRIGNNMSRFFQTSFESGIRRLRSEVDIDKLAREFAKSNPKASAIKNALPWKEFRDKAGGELAEDYFRATEAIGAEVADKMLPKVIRPDFDFSPNNSAIKKYIAERTGELITNLTNESKDAILDLVRREVTLMRRQGITPKTAAKNLAGNIGLNQQQATALKNYTQDLIGQDLSTSEISKKAEAYKRKLEKDRALMVARTESSFAVNQGEAEVWKQAVDQDLIDPKKTKKRWDAGAGACDDCQDMDGVEVPLDEQFTLPNGETVDTPPAHPNCGCSFSVIPEVA